MKKLQNNFTTPEQSKWLTELGVPADSADLAIVFNDKYRIQDIRYLNIEYSQFIPGGYERYYLPCWSVGRLIEIALICANIETRPYISFTLEQGWYATNNIEYMMSIFKDYAGIYMDFSKLEE